MRVKSTFLGRIGLNFVKKADFRTLKKPGSSEKALDNINANIPTGKLTGIIGSVGSGKSTIFSLLLNELDIESGNFPKFRTFGFASQEPWIISEEFDNFQNLLEKGQNSFLIP